MEKPALLAHDIKYKFYAQKQKCSHCLGRMVWMYGVNVTCLQNSGNKTVAFLCANGHFINVTYICDGVDHCGAGSDEDYNHAQCYSEYFIYICLSGNLSRYVPCQMFLKIRTLHESRHSVIS